MNNPLHVSALKEILEKSFSRYIRVLPNGFILPHENKIHPCLTVKLCCYYPARTWYQNKKPFCRTLDGISSVKNKKTCNTCSSKNQCTPQICVEVLYQEIPLKLLLAYTSMRKFIEYVSKLKLAPQSPSAYLMTLSVLNRGKWGEINFKSLN